MRNFEITESIPLLNRDGSLKQPGFARKPLFQYNREFLPARKIRVKEWDYYLIMTETYGVAFTMSDLGYVRMASATFLDFETRQQVTRTALDKPSLKYVMPASSVTGSASFVNREVDLRFESAVNGKHIYCSWHHFYKNSDLKCDIWFTELPEESMVIATPFENTKHFYLNQKTMCMPASGKIIFNWHVHHLDPAVDTGILDWGRGYWPYRVHWYWGCGSARIKGGFFGFTLGYGFGDTRLASENMLFWNGRTYKLDDVSFHIPENPMDPWKITSSDGRFEGTFHPQIDRASNISLGPFWSDQHQYFGLLDAQVILEPGQKLSISQMRCAMEDVHNRY